MKIGLINVDSKIPNLPLMKISAYHKQQGVQVEFYRPLFKKNAFTKALAKWCNRKQLTNSCSFEDYIKERKNYKEIKQVMKR